MLNVELKFGMPQLSHCDKIQANWTFICYVYKNQKHYFILDQFKDAF